VHQLADHHVQPDQSLVDYIHYVSMYQFIFVLENSMCRKDALYLLCGPWTIKTCFVHWALSMIILICFRLSPTKENTNFTYIFNFSSPNHGVQENTNAPNTYRWARWETDALFCLRPMAPDDVCLLSSILGFEWSLWKLRICWRVLSFTNFNTERLNLRISEVDDSIWL
jgi:hypothetical protein